MFATTRASKATEPAMALQKANYGTSHGLQWWLCLLPTERQLQAGPGGSHLCHDKNKWVHKGEASNKPKEGLEDPQAVETRPPSPKNFAQLLQEAYVQGANIAV